MLAITNKKQFTNYLILIGAIVVILNIVSRSLFFRLDLTDGDVYSLSESSKSVVGQLGDRLTAKVYFSGELPGTYGNSRRYLQDLLEEYQAYSGGQFRFEFVNPDQDQKAQEQAKNYQIPPVQLQAIENDKMEIKNVYMGLVFLYKDKKEVIPVIQTTQGLEYNLTATIKKLTSASLKNIGIISQENEEISTQNLSRFLEQVYNTRPVYLSADVPADIQVLLMNGLTDSLKSDELFHLDQFIMRGGRLFIAQGRVKDMLQQGFAMDIRSNIFTFLENYGITIGNELLIDQKCSQIQMRSQQGPFMFTNSIDYPPLPLIQKFNGDQVITKQMTVARVFFVNELSQSRDKLSKNTFTPLFYTSDRTGALPGPFYQIQPSQNPMMKAFPFASKVVAALLNGNMKSFFADSSRYYTKPNFIPLNPNGLILAISDNQFFNDKRGASFEENTEFILNAVDYMNGDQELIQIRSRDVKMRPLETLTDGVRRTYKWLNIILPSVLVVLLGLYKWKRNRDKRKMLEEIYA